MQTIQITSPLLTDLTFYLNVYKDVELLDVCLNQLRRVYPDTNVILRTDGDSDPKIAQVANHYNAQCYYGERLMPLEKGGQIVHEMLRLFLKHPTPYLFKIDPDTCIAHPFNSLPNEPCVFGRKQGTWENEPISLPSIQGGCLGITKDVAQRFYDSNFFLDPALAQRPPPWVLNEKLRPRPMVSGLTSIDWTVGWACKQMGIKVLDWPEIKSEWKISPENHDLRYAVTHPHKSAEDFKKCLPALGD